MQGQEAEGTGGAKLGFIIEKWRYDVATNIISSQRRNAAQPC